MVFLILTFYLIFFAGFADIGKAEGLSGTVSAKYMCRRYDIGADIVSANIGNIGGSAVSGTALFWSFKSALRTRFHDLLSISCWSSFSIEGIHWAASGPVTACL